MSDETQEVEPTTDTTMEEMAAAMEMEAQGQPPTPTQTPPPLAVPEDGQESETNLDRILDIPLQLSAQLGSTKMLIKELLQLGPGSVVELDKLAGEPLEVLVNNKLVARGEVVMVNEKFGIRLTDVVSPTERVNKLQ